MVINSSLQILAFERDVEKITRYNKTLIGTYNKLEIEWKNLRKKIKMFENGVK